MQFYLCIASSTLGPVNVVLTTSSSCIIISAPIMFCICIECSGVNMQSVPVK